MGKEMRGNYAALQTAEAERDAAKEALRCEREARAKIASEMESLTARLGNAIKSQNDNAVRAVEAWKVADEAKKAVDHLRAELASSASECRQIGNDYRMALRDNEALTKQRAQLADRLERASTPSKAEAKADRRLASKQAEIDALTAEVHKLKAFIRSIPKDVTIRREPQAGDTAITPEAYGRLERINSFTPDDVALSVDGSDRGLAILSRGPERLGTIRIDDGSIDLRDAAERIVGVRDKLSEMQADAAFGPLSPGGEGHGGAMTGNPTPVEAPSV